jgi:hypothetical protein
VTIDSALTSASDPGILEATVGRRRALQLAGAAALTGTALAAATGAVSPGLASAEIVLPKLDTELTENDKAIFGDAETFELAVVDLYKLLVGATSGDEQAIALAIHDHHVIHASACAALAGGIGTGEPNPLLFDQLVDPFSAGDLAMARQLEEAMISTHLELLGVVTSVKGSETLGAIINADAAHAAVLAELVGEYPLTEAESIANSLLRVTEGS